MIGALLFSCGDKDSPISGKVREIVVESYDATIGSSRTELIYDGDRLVGTKQFGSRLPVFTRYEYGRDEATFSDKISFYTSVGEEPERSGSVYVIEDAKITKRVGNGMVFIIPIRTGEFLGAQC